MIKTDESAIVPQYVFEDYCDALDGVVPPYSAASMISWCVKNERWETRAWFDAKANRKLFEHGLEEGFDVEES